MQREANYSTWILAPIYCQARHRRVAVGGELRSIVRVVVVVVKDGHSRKLRESKGTSKRELKDGDKRKKIEDGEDDAPKEYGNGFERKKNCQRDNMERLNE